MLEIFYDSLDEVQVGVDEAGRGCFAGPVVAAAVIWDHRWVTDQLQFSTSAGDTVDGDCSYPEHLGRMDMQPHNNPNAKLLRLIKDSKKLSKKNRTTLSHFIKEHALAYHIKYVAEKTIDDINILNATYQAMHGALDGLNCRFDRILVDGDKFLPYRRKPSVLDGDADYWCVPHMCVPNGDNVYLSIASASILAKVSRDTYMEELASKNMDLNAKYDWVNNKGYGTKKHLDGIRAHGISVHHRRTFGICKEF
jgi:ribonuclease HII